MKASGSSTNRITNPCTTIATALFAAYSVNKYTIPAEATILKYHRTIYKLYASQAEYENAIKQCTGTDPRNIGKIQISTVIVYLDSTTNGNRPKNTGIENKKNIVRYDDLGLLKRSQDIAV